MIGCLGGGAQPAVKNNIVNDELEEAHVEVLKEAIKASGITVAVGVAIIFLGVGITTIVRT